MDPAGRRVVHARPAAASSCIPVPGSDRIVTSLARASALSVWFKTSAATGVLLGLTSIVPGGCTALCPGQRRHAAAVDRQQRAPGGSRLDRETGIPAQTATALSSSAAVDNGAWHQAVLIPGQALYLDGTRSPPAPRASPASGRGRAAGRRRTAGPRVELRDRRRRWVAVLQRVAGGPRRSTRTSSQFGHRRRAVRRGNPAGGGTDHVTSPGGRTELSATYDTVNDRVPSLTDAHGGTWTYSGAGRPARRRPPTTTRCWASSPEDFWPLNDASGPLASDLVGGAATAAGPAAPGDLLPT